MDQRESADKAEDPAVMPGLLSAVECDSALTQRHLARELAQTRS
jgi:hypothetical protein